MILRSGDREATPEPSLCPAGAIDSLIWPCFCHCHVDVCPMSSFRVDECRASNSNGVPFIISLVDTSPNLAFMVVAKKFNFALITPNYFVPEVLGLVSLLFGML